MDRAPLELWLPGGDHLADPSERENLVSDYCQAVEALDDFLTGKVPPLIFLERLDSHGVEIDTYIDDISFNLLHNA